MIDAAAPEYQQTAMCRGSNLKTKKREGEFLRAFREERGVLLPFYFLFVPKNQRGLQTLTKGKKKKKKKKKKKNPKEKRKKKKKIRFLTLSEPTSKQTIMTPKELSKS